MVQEGGIQAKGYDKGGDEAQKKGYAILVDGQTGFPGGGSVEIDEGASRAELRGASARRRLKIFIPVSSSRRLNAGKPFAP